MSHPVQIYPDRCEVCARDWGDELLSTLPHRDFCNHWHWDFQNWTRRSRDEFTSSITGPPPTAPYDADDPLYGVGGEFDLLR